MNSNYELSLSGAPHRLECKCTSQTHIVEIYMDLFISRKTAISTSMNRSNSQSMDTCSLEALDVTNEAKRYCMTINYPWVSIYQFNSNKYSWHPFEFWLSWYWLIRLLSIRFVSCLIWVEHDLMELPTLY